MAVQEVARKRCVSCKRWAGRRWPGAEPGTVEYDEHDARGLCTEGPWHGTLRSVRNACGQSVMWGELAPTAETPPAPADGAADT